jgi:membrane protease YdiL (CAAX protease family)
VLLLALFLKKTEGSPVAKTMWMSKAPTFKSLLLIVLVWIVALPAMNYIVEWNNNLHLPASLKDIEQYLREMEDSAQAVTSSLLSTKSWGMMIMMVVVVALLTALGEETFFRAGLLGSMHTGKVNRHVAVWTVAILFSAFHMQFYGFVPRMLLGAWFGYVMLWCGEVWTPMIGHALNNGMVVIMTFLADQHIIGENYLDKLGNDNHWLALGSAVLTAIVIIVFMRKRNTNETTTL